jgi:aurora kinase, other
LRLAFPTHTIVVVVASITKPLTMVYPYALSPFCKSGYLCYCCGTDIYVRCPNGILSISDISRHERRDEHFPKTRKKDRKRVVSKLRRKEEKLVNRVYRDLETNIGDLTKYLVGNFLVIPAEKFPFCLICNRLFKYRVRCPCKDGLKHQFAETNQDGYSVRGWIHNNPGAVSVDEDLLYAHPWLLRMLRRHRPGDALPRRAIGDGNAVEMTERNDHESDSDESTIRPVSSIAHRRSDDSQSMDGESLAGSTTSIAQLKSNDDEANENYDLSVGSTASTIIAQLKSDDEANENYDSSVGSTTIIVQLKSDDETNENLCINYFTSDGFESDKEWSKDDFVFSSDGNLGEGSYGSVDLVRERTLDGLLALKAVDSNEDVEREITIQTMLDHRNIVRLYDFFKDKGKTFMMLEYCNGGTLFGKLDDLEDEEHFSAEFIVPTLLQLVDALIFCHSKHIIHCDIKLENILIGKNEEIKLADFGLSIQMKTKRPLPYPGGGTIIYMSPEMLTGNAFNEKTDIWSLGVLLYELLAKTVPFPLLQEEEEVLQVPDPDPGVAALAQLKIQHELCARIKDVLTKKALKFPSVVAEGARDLVLKMLQIDPKQRIVLEEVRNHAWVQDVLGTIAHRAEKQEAATRVAH